MYRNDNFKQLSDDTFSLQIAEGEAYKILQLTDLHLGFGLFSQKKDRQAMDAMTALVKRTSPDLIVITGDSIYPFWPHSGSMNNEKEAKKFMAFMDSFEIPYALVMGNHDTELGSKLGRYELGSLFKTGQYSIFTEGPKDIYGVGNYIIELRRGNELVSLLCMLDSNMYVTKWFYDGFDCIHSDQTRWCMEKLNQYKSVFTDIEAMAFYHMPLPEFKEAYEKMKFGDTTIQYHFGTVSEKEDYFGISRLSGDFFEKAKENGVIRYMFCGHDHVNNISLTYKGIRMTYGMSIDCLGYKGIHKQNIHRGATEILLMEDRSLNIRPVPLTDFVTKSIRGIKE